MNQLTRLADQGGSTNGRVWETHYSTHAHERLYLRTKTVDFLYYTRVLHICLDLSIGDFKQDRRGIRSSSYACTISATTAAGLDRAELESPSPLLLFRRGVRYLLAI